MVLVEFEVEPGGIYTLINNLHKTFARNILEWAKYYTPADDGDLRASWDTTREDVDTTHVYLPNDNEGAKWDLPGVGKADWLLRGTGLYGPLKRPYCGKRIEPVTDPTHPIRIRPMAWRNREGVLMIRQCVNGINPREIHGDNGPYDFEQDLHTAVKTGVSVAAKEWNQ